MKVDAWHPTYRRFPQFDPLGILGSARCDFNIDRQRRVNDKWCPGELVADEWLMTKAYKSPNVSKCMTWISSIDLDLWSISPILWPENHSCSLFRYKSSHFRYFPSLSSVFSWHLSGGYQECRWQRLASSQLGLGMVRVWVLRAKMKWYQTWFLFIYVSLWSSNLTQDQICHG